MARRRRRARIWAGLAVASLLAGCGGSDYPTQNDELQDRFGGEPEICDVQVCIDEPPISAHDKADAGPPGSSEDLIYECNEYIGCVDLGPDDSEIEEDRVDALNEDRVRAGCMENWSTDADRNACMAAHGF